MPDPRFQDHRVPFLAGGQVLDLVFSVRKRAARNRQGVDGFLDFRQLPLLA